MSGHESKPPWSPPKGRVYAGCPTCGMVTTVVSDGDPADLPWCVHHETTVAWRSGSTESGWTPMVIVAIAGVAIGGMPLSPQEGS